MLRAHQHARARTFLFVRARMKIGCSTQWGCAHALARTHVFPRTRKLVWMRHKSYRTTSFESITRIAYNRFKDLSTGPRAGPIPIKSRGLNSIGTTKFLLYLFIDSSTFDHIQYKVFLQREIFFSIVFGWPLSLVNSPLNSQGCRNQLAVLLFVVQNN